MVARINGDGHFANHLVDLLVIQIGQVLIAWQQEDAVRLVQVGNLRNEAVGRVGRDLEREAT